MSQRRTTYINLAIVAAIVAVAALFYLLPRRSPGPNPPVGPNGPLTNANELISEFQLSLAELENSDYEAAASRLQTLVEQLPNETAVHRNLALTYLVGIDDLTGHHEQQKVARREELLSLMERALDRLKEFPDEQVPWALFSSRRAQALKQDAQAIEFLKTAVELAPGDPAFPYEMSRVAYSSPDNTLQAAGLDGLEKAYAANPENLWVLQEVLVRQAEAKSTGLSDTLEKAATSLGVVQSEILRKHRIDVVELVTEAKDAVASDNSSVLLRNVRMVANVLRPEDAAQSDKIQLEKHPLEFVALSLSSDVLSQAKSAETNAASGDDPFDFEEASLPDELAKDAIDVAVGDFDLNEIDDLCVLRTNEVSLWGRQVQDGEWSLICSAALDADYTNVVAVDLDADEREAPRTVQADLPGNPDCRRADMDLLLYGPAGILLLKNQLDQETGARILVPQQLDSDEKLAVSAVSVVDVDIDGDLDILAATGPGNIQQWSNKTDWAFALRTDSPANLPQDFVVRQFLPVDIDRDVDLDILVVGESGQCGMLENLRHGIVRYRDLMADDEPVRGSSLAISDWNADATWDLFVLQNAEVQFLRGVTSGEGKISYHHTGSQNLTAERIQVADFDNDGHEDLLGEADDSGLQLVSPHPASETSAVIHLLPALSSTAGPPVTTSDINSDGKLDLLVVEDGAIKLFVNNSQGAGNWFHLGLVAEEFDPNSPAISSHRMNHYAIGSTVEVRAGNHFQARVVKGPHTHFGLGDIEQVDSIRIIWTNGIPQHHLTPPVNTLLCESQVVISSCPYLYAESGSGTHFVTDLLWASPLGLPSPTGELVPSRPWEYIKIPGELLEPVDGKYRLHITEELREATYLDEVRLVAVDHPAEVEVFTNEKVGPPSVAEHKLHVTGNLRVPLRVTNQHGRDLLPEVASVDDIYAKPFDDQLAHGLTEPTVVEMQLALDEQAGDQPQVKLFLTGWLHAPDAGVSAAIHEHVSAGGTLLSIPQPLSLWVPNENGEWTEAIPFTGFVGGKTKTIVLDVSEVLNRNDPRVQLRSSMEFAWDRIAYSVNDPEVEVIETPLELLSADLHYRGVSSVTPHPHNGPDHYDYDQVPFTPQVGTMQGHFTRFGDVLPLLESSDNMLVVEGPGDELTLEFAAVPAPPEGWTRDFVIYSVGWDKDAQMHTVYGQSSEPLPFHEMSSYPYIESPPETEEYQEYLREYQTRTLNNAGFRKALVP